MKKLPVIMAILGVFLAVLGTGIPIYSHFCNGELDSISMYAESNSCCDSDNIETTACHKDVLETTCCSESAENPISSKQKEKKKDCCSDDIAFIAIDSSYCIPDCSDEVQELAFDINEEAVKFATELYTYIQHPSIDQVSVSLDSTYHFIVGNQSESFDIIPRAPGKKLSL